MNESRLSDRSKLSSLSMGIDMTKSRASSPLLPAFVSVLNHYRSFGSFTEYTSLQVGQLM